MAVVRLSMMMTVPLPLLWTMFSSGATPAWKNVPSPMVHTAGSGSPERPMPCSTPTLAPMAPMVCWALKGGRVPRL